ncbi:hypothetical protein OPQ81_001350 [Rhizoctonia solani]|nr:hypothetical protein OPQ81_001350 [Rhizoctonia solani]
MYLRLFWGRGEARPRRTILETPYISIVTRVRSQRRCPPWIIVIKFKDKAYSNKDTEKKSHDPNEPRPRGMPHYSVVNADNGNGQFHDRERERVEARRELNNDGSQ